MDFDKTQRLLHAIVYSTWYNPSALEVDFHFRRIVAASARDRAPVVFQMLYCGTLWGLAAS